MQALFDALSVVMVLDPSDMQFWGASPVLAPYENSQENACAH
jgi:hypothetical protein